MRDPLISEGSMDIGALPFVEKQLSDGAEKMADAITKPRESFREKVLRKIAEDEARAAPGPAERMAIDGLAKWSDKVCDELFVKHAVDHAPDGDQTVVWTEYVQPTDTVRIKIDARPAPSLQAYFDQLKKQRLEIGPGFHAWAASAMNAEAQAVLNRSQARMIQSIERGEHDAFNPPPRQYPQPLDLDDVEVGAVRAKAFELAIKQSIKTVGQLSQAQSVEALIGSARMIEEYLLNG